jgi:hypothetical protein
MTLEAGKPLPFIFSYPTQISEKIIDDSLQVTQQM